MKAKELQIGDYVNYRGQIIKVSSLYDKGGSNEVGWSDKENVWVNADNVKPILITKELLEKNGFKEDKNITYCRQYVYVCDLHAIPQTVIEMSFYGEGVSARTLFECHTKTKSCYGENNLHICDLQYVHQLQAALRMCGIEKEIVL